MTCLRIRIPLALAICLGATAASADELSLLLGSTHSSEHGFHTGAWALDYQHNLSPHVALGISHVNEGHATNSHRDGAAVQLRARATVFDPRLTLVAGVGPAYLASGWRRHVRVPEEGHVPASVWEPRLLALFVTATVQLGLYAGVLVAAGGFRVDELFHDGAPIFAFVVPATFVAAAFALTQRVAQVVWTPVAGRWSDRSASWAFVTSTVVALTSVALLALLRPDPVLFVVIGGVAFVNGLTTTIAVELVVSRRSRDHDRPRILAALHTWQDAGAAGGALLGGVLAAIGAAPALLVGAALLGLTLPLWWAAMRA